MRFTSCWPLAASGATFGPRHPRGERGVEPSFLTIWAERRHQIKGTVSADHLHSTWCRVIPRCCSHTGNIVDSFRPRRPHYQPWIQNREKKNEEVDRKSFFESVTDWLTHTNWVVCMPKWVCSWLKKHVSLVRCCPHPKLVSLDNIYLHIFLTCVILHNGLLIQPSNIIISKINK